MAEKEGWSYFPDYIYYDGEKALQLVPVNVRGYLAFRIPATWGDSSPFQPIHLERLGVMDRICSAEYYLDYFVCKRTPAIWRFEETLLFGEKPKA